MFVCKQIDGFLHCLDFMFICYLANLPCRHFASSIFVGFVESGVNFFLFFNLGPGILFILAIILAVANLSGIKYCYLDI